MEGRQVPVEAEAEEEDQQAQVGMEAQVEMEAPRAQVGMEDPQAQAELVMAAVRLAVLGLA